MRMWIAVLLLAILLAASCCAAYAVSTEGPRITDAQLFSMLDLDYPGLQKVKAAVQAGDIASAKHEFAEYLRHRQKPVWNPTWLAGLTRGVRTGETNTKEADRIMQRDLPSVGVYHKFDGEIDWTLNPINYNEWPWQLNRHPFWTTLGVAYLATGEEKYAKEFVYQMTDWVHKCPPPTENDGRRSATWRTIEAGIRMGHNWPAAYYIFLQSPSFTDEAIVTMVESMVDHAQFLMRWPSTGNWLTMECNGLMHVGVLFPEFKDAETWRKTAGDRLYAELDRQVYPDGAQIELSTGYHQVALLNFAMAWDIAHLNGDAMPADYVAKMQRMFNYDLDVAMPNGYAPGLNDANRTNMSSEIKRALTYFPDRKDFLWLSTLGKEGTTPTVGSVALPFAGHMIMRTGWDRNDLYSLFDAGPFGYGHQHEDALNFVLYAYGKYMLVDPGNYPYDSSDWRKYAISTRAHNTIMVDGCEQHRRDRPREQYVLSKPMPIKWYSNTKYDYASSSYDDGYAHDNSVKVKHVRSVFFVKPEYWIVVDRMVPADTAQHKYDSAFHLDMSGAKIDDATRAVVTTDENGANLSIIPMADPKLKVSIISGEKTPMVQGWIRSGEYTCRPIPTPVFEKEQAGETALAYVFYPTPEGVKCPVTAVTPVSVKGSEDAVAMAIEFDNGRVDYFAQCAEPGAAISFAKFHSDAPVTYIRTEDGRVVTSAPVSSIEDLSNTTVRHKF